MNAFRMTEHAQRRKQQRGISDLAIQLLEQHGDFAYQKGGTHVVRISERTLSQLRKALDEAEHIALVTSDEERVITVMHEHRKVRSTQYVA